MAILETSKASIKGICVTLPKERRSIYDLGKGNFTVEEIDTISKGVGVEFLYESEKNQTASDLCLNSAEKLIEELSWEKESIDGLVFVTQTPDYIAPATACVLQNKLGLSTNCVAFDTNYGCSGFIGGMFLANQLIETKVCDRVLVLVGDTLRRLSSEYDKGLFFILSDAGAAVAVEKNDHKMITSLYTDGSGYSDLIVPAGGSRIPKDEYTCKVIEAEEGNRRSKENYYMHGMNVFTFAVKRVPQCLKEILDLMSWDKDEIDYYFLHQANAYMVKYITKRAKIDMNKCPININKYGNTSGVSIPLLLTDYYPFYKGRKIKAVLCGFGVGLSWGAIATELYDLKCCDIQYI